MVNLLAISTGNTRTRLGTFVEGKLVQALALDNTVAANEVDESLRRAMAPLSETDDPAVLIASVNEPASTRMAGRVEAVLGVRPQYVERDMNIPIGRQLDVESLVGEDRLLNAAAAYHAVKQVCVVVDAGTALTVDFIDGAGTFHGGAIAPGARMMLDALHEGTQQLPEVELRKPQEPIGHNTAEAMRTGVFHGMRGIVRELTERYAEVNGIYPIVIATGGDAALLFDGYELIDRIVPDLTLMGMALTAQTYFENQPE